MFLLVAAAVLNAPAPIVPERQARATVRIERAAVLRFAEVERDQPHRLRTTELRGSDGVVVVARVVEFE